MGSVLGDHWLTTSGGLQFCGITDDVFCGLYNSIISMGNVLGGSLGNYIWGPTVGSLGDVFVVCIYIYIHIHIYIYRFCMPPRGLPCLISPHKPSELAELKLLSCSC